MSGIFFSTCIGTNRQVYFGSRTGTPVKKESETPDVLGWGVVDDARFPPGKSSLSERQSLPSPKVTPQPKISGVFLLVPTGLHPLASTQPWWRGMKAVDRMLRLGCNSRTIGPAGRSLKPGGPKGHEAGGNARGTISSLLLFPGG